MAVKQKYHEHIPAEYRKPAVIPAATIKEYGAFEEYYEYTEKIYNEIQTEFLSTDPRDPEILKKEKKCEDAARAMIMMTAALFGRHTGKMENKDKALAMLDQCKKDAGIRAKNIILHKELAEKELHPDPEQREEMQRAVLRSLIFHTRAYNTQTSCLNRYVNDPNYVTPELAAEKEASKSVAKGMKMIPKGHYFLPARPFPPARIPEGERVPYPPEAYAAWKDLPIEDFYFDTEHDEFALPKGYVSPDGRIDDESVIWDWENNTVTMKFRGGEPVTWPFWKPKDTYDVLKEGDWCAEYYIRLYRQHLEDIEPPGLSEI